MKILTSAIACALIASCCGTRIWAQSSIVPNPSFEQGADTPSNWTRGGSGAATWATTGHTGRRSLEIGPTASGQAAYWQASRVVLEPGGLYRLSFWSRAENSQGGCIISGVSTANHDFSYSPIWKQYGFIFRATGRAGEYLRLGQWDAQGSVYFDDVSLTPLSPIPSRHDDVDLGNGETIDGASYNFHAPLESTNYSRPLADTSAAFNTNRWVLTASSRIAYRHQIGGRSQIAANVVVNVNYYKGGALNVAASNDGANWIPVGSLDHGGLLQVSLPASLFPAKSIWVRMECPGLDRAGARGDSAPGSLQVDSYEYHADLATGATAPLVGETHFVDNLASSESLRVAIQDLGPLLPGPASSVRLIVENPAESTAPATASLTFTHSSGRRVLFQTRFSARHGENTVEIPYDLRAAGQYHLDLNVAVKEVTLYRAAVDFAVSSLAASDFGYRVGFSDESDIWCSDAPYKISRARGVPAAMKSAVELRAARNEYADFQLVAHPARALSRVTIECTALAGPGGFSPNDPSVAIREVGYVHVRQPTDDAGLIGEWPDPLVPLAGPTDLEANRNQPFWIDVHVPQSARPGDYKGTIRLRAPGWLRTVPIRLHVYDFALPTETHVKTAFGLSSGSIRTYQNLKSPSDTLAVMRKYYLDFAEHRISPYDAVYGSPIDVDWGLSAANAGAGNLPPVTADQVKIDFTRFDRAMDEAISRYHINSFRLHPEGMGGGTFADRKPGHIGLYAAGTPAYEILMASYLRQLQDHLEARGWLDKTIVYWFDEPAPQDYSFVKSGMELLQKYAPKLNRFLTVQPVPKLYGSVNTWCVETPNYDASAAHERQAAGDNVWWYICSNPKAPYVTEFIDHPALEPRLWLWQTWKYGVQGILVWDTVYWNSPMAYPDALQNPWTDPMSWVDGDRTAGSARIPWGNGDGRFLYPPNTDPAHDKQPILDGPIDSVRWQMLRDGIQDYEYFYLLRQKIEAAHRRADNSAAVGAAAALLTIPSDIVQDMTTYTGDPHLLLAYKDRLAHAIESFP